MVTNDDDVLIEETSPASPGDDQPPPPPPKNNTYPPSFEDNQNPSPSTNSPPHTPSPPHDTPTETDDANRGKIIRHRLISLNLNQEGRIIKNKWLFFSLGQ